MKPAFVKVKDVPEAPQILWDLLAERTPEQSISHKQMPTAEEHLAFVSKPPYRCWYLIADGKDYVGSAYLTRKNEIGISIFKAHQGKGYGSWAIKQMVARWKNALESRAGVAPNAFIANINPANEISAGFFKKNGFRLVSHTYQLDV